MLDGRIDTQGLVKDLRAQGALDEITHDESVEVHKEEQQVKEEEPPVVAADPTSEAAPQENTKKPRKLIEEEKRAIGRIGKDIWTTYLKACGGTAYWILFSFSLIIAADGPVLQNGWLKCVYTISGAIMTKLLTVYVTGFGPVRLPTLRPPSRLRTI